LGQKLHSKNTNFFHGALINEPMGTNCQIK